MAWDESEPEYDHHKESKNRGRPKGSKNTKPAKGRRAINKDYYLKRPKQTQYWKDRHVRLLLKRIVDVDNKIILDAFKAGFLESYDNKSTVHQNITRSESELDLIQLSA